MLIVKVGICLNTGWPEYFGLSLPKNRSTTPEWIVGMNLGLFDRVKFPLLEV